jgi:hypothetical protein
MKIWRHGEKLELCHPNHPLRYATHQHPNSSGKVRARLHQIGSVKSMAALRTMNSIQKILRSIAVLTIPQRKPFAAKDVEGRKGKTGQGNPVKVRRKRSSSYLSTGPDFPLRSPR